MKVLVCIPCFDMVPTPFARSLAGMHWTCPVEITFAQGSLVYDARDQLADKAIREHFDRILWLDSDMTFEHDVFQRLMDDLDAGHGMVSGIYYKRKEPIQPMVFSKIDVEEKNGGSVPSSECILQIPEKSIFQIEACGFGCVMMDTSYVEQVSSAFGLPFYPVNGFGEDFSFCWRLKQLGLPVYADSAVQCGHIGQWNFTAQTYQDGRPILWKTVS